MCRPPPTLLLISSTLAFSLTSCTHTFGRGGCAAFKRDSRYPSQDLTFCCGMLAQSFCLVDFCIFFPSCTLSMSQLQRYPTLAGGFYVLHFHFPGWEVDLVPSKERVLCRSFHHDLSRWHLLLSTILFLYLSLPYHLHAGGGFRVCLVRSGLSGIQTVEPFLLLPSHSDSFLLIHTG